MGPDVERDEDVDEATPADAVQRENGESELPPGDEGGGEDARRHAGRIEQHNRQVTAPTDPG